MALSQSTIRTLRDIKNRPPEKLDRMTQAIHEEVFAQTDCCECAACCKRISPRMVTHDLLRLSKNLKMTLDAFTVKYITIDEDREFVFKSAPCPFLGSDNLCSVYDDRPTACREYPHTDRRRFHQLIDKSIANAAICPAVEKILVKLAEVTGKMLSFRKR